MAKIKVKKFSKRVWLFRLIRVSFAVGIAFFLCQIELGYLEALTYDLRIRTKPPTPISGHVTIVAIDPETQIQLERQPNAKDHLDLIRALTAAQPRAIVYTIDPGEVTGSYEELETFALATTRVPFYVAADRLPVKGLEEEFKLLAPLDVINVVSGPKTWDKKTFAKDGVSRRVIYSFQNQQILHPRLAGTYNGKSEDDEYRGLFKFKRTTQAYIDYRPTGTYPKHSFLDVVDSKINAENFRDKIVIIGRDTKSHIEDYVLTPYSRDILAMSKAELHANMLDTFIQNKAPILSPSWLDYLITALISILTVAVVLTVRPAKGLLILLTSMGSFSVLSWILMSVFGLWIPMAHPLLAIFICYYFFIPYRLIIENRRSWEYYKRNELLTQVEELKSNFMRMMSHDLKTPLARIQGMTEVVMKDVTPLSDQQKKAIGSISESSDELNSFIGSILDLGRIESKEIKLHLKSKDINQLMTEVINKCEHLAQQKNIEIIAEFEPMFSVRVDDTLMKQVFTNLVENAIKYSPADSKILITTEDANGSVIVQVSDQGIGIPKKEIDNVFLKFYRSGTVKDSEVKGSGLGLYLAHYFVDLHQGKISVDSQASKGSTFTVELPMDLQA